MATIADGPIGMFAQFMAENSPPQVAQGEPANATWALGDLLFISSGYTSLCGANPSVIYGVALRAGQNDPVAGHTMSQVGLVDPGTLFTMNVKNNLTDYVLKQSDIGTFMAVQRDPTSHYWFCDSSQARGGANVRVFVHAPSSDSAVGDTNARVLVNFCPRFVQFLGTS